MELGHYLNDLKSAQFSIKEMSQSLSRESVGNDEEVLIEKEELSLELGPFRFSRKKEVHRSSTNSMHRKELEGTQSGVLESCQVLSQSEEKKALLTNSTPLTGEANESFALWKGVDRKA